MTMVAPVGVSNMYDVIIPNINVIMDIDALEMTTDLKFLNTCMEVILGNIIKLDIRSEPIILIPITTTNEQSPAKMTLYFSVSMPIDFANFSSNVIANILLYDSVYSSNTAIVSSVLSIMSFPVTDNILPNKYEFISVFTPFDMDIIKVPMAKALADNSAIAESPCIFVLFNFKIINEDMSTAGMATYSGSKFNTLAIATPPNPTCDSPSPIMEFLLSTNDTPIRDAQTDINNPAIKALCINS